jgi:hypothetical protein
MHSGHARFESIIRYALAGIAGCSLLMLALIMLFLFYEGLPVFGVLAPKDFFFGIGWYPTSEPPEFGILPLMAGSVAVTAVSSVIAIPLGSNDGGLACGNSARAVTPGVQAHGGITGRTAFGGRGLFRHGGDSPAVTGLV